MSAKNYANTLEKCARIAEQAKDASLQALNGWMQDSMDEDYIPTLGLVTFGANRNNCLDLIRTCMGLELPQMFAPVLYGSPRQIMLTYASAPTISGEEAQGDCVALGLPCDSLKRHRVLVFDGLSDEKAWLTVSGEADCLCLVANATMAMSQSEREWLEKCAKPLFNGDEVLVTLTQMDTLNSDEERETVTRNVTAALKRIGINATFFPDPVEAIAAARSHVSGSGAQERRRDRIMKNGLAAMRDRLNAIYDDEAVESLAVENLMAQLEKKRQMLSTAGDSAAEVTLYNAFQPLSLMAERSARKYGSDMALRIRQQVEGCKSIQELETMPEKLQAYIKNSWQYFFEHVQDKCNGEVDRIIRMLAARMDMDAGLLIQDLDAPAIELMRRAFAQNADSREAPIVGTCRPDGLVPGKLEDVRRETRNMMLLSVPLLLFGSPALAVGNIVLSKVLGNYRDQAVFQKARQDWAEHAAALCSETTQDVIRSMSREFNRQLEAVQTSTRKAYGELIDHIGEKLEQLKNRQIEREAFKLDLHRQIQAALADMPENT